MRRIWNTIALALGLALSAAVVTHGTTASFHDGLHAAEEFIQQSSGAGFHAAHSPECDFCKGSVQDRDFTIHPDASSWVPAESGKNPLILRDHARYSTVVIGFSSRAPPA